MLYLQVQREEDAELSQCDRAIQMFALNFCFIPIVLVLFHMHQVPLILQRARLAQLVDALSFKHWDLGSIPRSPPFSILFCLICSYAACLPVVHHASTIKACHMAQETNLKVRMRGPSYTSVDHATHALEKVNRP